MIYKTVELTGKAGAGWFFVVVGFLFVCFFLERRRQCHLAAQGRNFRQILSSLGG